MNTGQFSNGGGDTQESQAEHELRFIWARAVFTPC